MSAFRAASFCVLSSVVFAMLTAGCDAVAPPPTAEQMPKAYIEWIASKSAGTAHKADDSTLRVSISGVSLHYGVEASMPQCESHSGGGLACNIDFRLSLQDTCNGAQNYNQAAKCMILWTQPKVIPESGTFLLRHSNSGTPWEFVKKLD